MEEKKTLAHVWRKFLSKEETHIIGFNLPKHEK